MPTLASDLRNKLERVVIDARDAAEDGAHAALEALAVHHYEPYPHMKPAQRELRNHLRARARQLGDQQDKSGRLAINHLVNECAYEHWHRMLFARFLAENSLLIEPEENMAISLAEAEELAKEQGIDVWVYASRCAQDMLPQIFRPDDPLLQVSFAKEHRVKLESLLASLPAEVFTASDALGWVYQFWQSKKKDEVNRSEVKIGADEISAVTQLFTEPYMVEFLLHNTLGAWWAGKRLTAEDAENAATEDELRKKVSLPGVDWSYLRFVRDNLPSPSGRGAGGEGQGPWRPAAGTFDGWPKAAKDIKVLDPCCGSGHFLVAALHHLVPIRMAEEGLSAADAVDAVLRDNLHGLEIDERCCQIAAFALAFAAWTYPNLPSPIGRGQGEGILGYRQLPELHIACTGIGPQCTADEWIKLAEKSGIPMPAVGREAIKNGLLNLHHLFSQAPTLGSLINPAELPSDMFVADFETIQPYLTAIHNAEKADDETRERAIAAEGMVKASDLLASDYTLVVTNVPYLGREKQDSILQAFADAHYSTAIRCLSTIFLCRSFKWVTNAGVIALVTPQNWLFQSRYIMLRKDLLTKTMWNLTVRLGEHAFESPAAAGAFAAMIVLTRAIPEISHALCVIDASAQRGEPPIHAYHKAAILSGEVPVKIHCLSQISQLGNPDHVIRLDVDAPNELMSIYGRAWQGMVTGDDNRYIGNFWEIAWDTRMWRPMQQAPIITQLYTGRSDVVRWENGRGNLHNDSSAHNFPPSTVLSRIGIAIQRVSQICVTLFTGDVFDDSVAPFIPAKAEDLPAIWAFCESSDFRRAVRSVNQSLKVVPGTINNVRFDLAHWQEVAAEKYPDGLPEPESDDPTQWLFHGWPVVNLPAASKPPLQPLAEREAATATLQVAVARLMGFRWPAETEGPHANPLPEGNSPSPPTPLPKGEGSCGMRLSKRARALVEKCGELAKYADDDGIVCIPAVRGEEPAAERLRRLLAAAYGENWTAEREQQLIRAAGSTAADLDEWLRNDFFEQHCKLFHDRPFVWHIWDGRKRDGFHALVNYHKLAESDGRGQRLLESLTYAYLGEWITRQKDGVKRGEGGAEDRLAAAVELQKRLEAILEGEPPYDIFVRWKPLAEQPIGWEPDINDGVRLNIRPFLASDLPGGKKGAGILRYKPNIKWTKDRGKEPERPKDEYPWLWGWDEKTEDFLGGNKFDGNRWNACHYTNKAKQVARDAAKKGEK